VQARSASFESASPELACTRENRDLREAPQATRCPDPGGSEPAVAKFAKRGEVERVCGEAITVGNMTDLIEPVLGTLALRDCDGAIERDNRGRTNQHNLS
jgi:hypothetical protein